MERFVYLIYRTFTRALAALPLNVAFRLGSGLGWLAYLLFLPYRRLAIRNLSLAFAGEKSKSEVKALAREHFRLLGANFLSMAKVGTFSTSQVREVVEVDNSEEFHQSAVSKQGVVLVISHMGNWEILAQICPLLFPGKGSTIYQKLGNRYIDADIRKARARQGLTLFERKEGFVGAIALVRDGGGVGVLVDQHAGDKGLWSPFFGRLASTTPLAATIALRTGALMIPAGLTTVGPGRWRLRFAEPIDLSSRDPARITAEMNAQLEALIRTSPADWFWVHNRWKLPQPNFLLSHYKRGVTLPPSFDGAKLKPFRILIRSSNWLGDAVMTTPAVQAIKQGRPDAHVTILTPAKLAEYWKRVPEVDSVLPINSGQSLFSTAAMIRSQSAPFDVSIVLPNSMRTALEPWLAGVPRRVGYPTQGRGCFLNQPILPSKRKNAQAIAPPASHQVFHYLEIAERIGADVEDLMTGRDPARLFSQPAVKSTCPERERRSGKLIIGLCPGAEFGPAKRWSPDSFAATMQLVSAEHEVEWRFFGVPGDAPVGDEILAALKLKGGLAGGSLINNRIGETTLGGLIDELAECTLLLTNDTGTMHLATALTVPVVAIFGSTEPRLTGPLGQGHAVLRHQVECSPCFQRTCPLDFRCMAAIRPEEAARAILQSLKA